MSGASAACWRASIERTLHRLRREIAPVPAATFLRFLLQWQYVAEGEHKAGSLGLEEIVHQLEGFETAAGSWEDEVLPMRVEDYEPLWLDNLCLAGKAQWRRRSRPSTKPRERRSGRFGPVRSTPIALVRRQHQDLWTTLSNLQAPAAPDSDGSTEPSSAPKFLASPAALRVLEYLQNRGASFFDEIASSTGLLHTQLEPCLAELVSLGTVSSDNFLGLRALLVPANKKKSPGARRRTVNFGVEDAGRWSALEGHGPSPQGLEDGDLEALAWILLRRWGVIFRKLMDRETGMPPWRDLLRVLRRLEARGEIRGGRFVNRFFR